MFLSDKLTRFRWVETGSVVLQSVFVARAGADNGSIQRSLVRHFHAEGVVRESRITEDIADLRLRGEPANGFEKDLVFCPCRFEEFNGAGLFYFAEFAAFVSRALCMWEGKGAARWLDGPLSMLFLRNIEPGEAVQIGLHAQAKEDRHRCTLQRLDGSVLARVAYGP